MREIVAILGTPIDILSTSEVLKRLEQFIDEGRFHQVATANTDFLVNGFIDPELRYILRNADLVMPDGMPVVWASRMLGCPLPERVTGADIVPALAELSAEKGYRIYMLGARPEVAQLAKQKLLERYPTLQIVGCLSPPLAPLIEMDSESILQDIAKSKPDILFVAFGNPKQEKWIAQYRNRLQNVPVCIGVGGTFDFLAGENARAPGWMQRGGLEWIHRLVHEPRRLWRRYVKDITLFSSYMAHQWWEHRQTRFTGSTELHSAKVSNCTVISIVGDFCKVSLSQFEFIAEEAFKERTHLIIDFNRVSGFDAQALGMLLNLPKRAAFHSTNVRLVSMPPAMMAAIRRNQMQDGLYTLCETLAEAFTADIMDGMSLCVHAGANSAVITASGRSNERSTQMLERAARRILESGKRLDFDLRDVIYTDVHLISTLFKLTRDYGTEKIISENDSCHNVRICAGSSLKESLIREKCMSKFILIELPELPEDAAEISVSGQDRISILAQDVSLSIPSDIAFAPRI